MRYSRFILCLILLLLLFTLPLSGCGDGVTNNMSNNGDIVELSFADAVSFEDIKKLDGSLVSITGFMATTSPLDGSYFYLQNMPYQSCPFCLPNSNTLANTLAVYAPEGKSFKFTDLPMKVTGRIKVGDVTDDLGFHYTYRLVDAQIQRAEVNAMNKDIQIYTALVDRGFASKMTEAFGMVYRVINYEQFDLSSQILSGILNDDLVNGVKDTFSGLNVDDYSEILEVVVEFEHLVEEINSLIEDEQWDALNDLNIEAKNLYTDFYNWLIRPQI